MIKYDLKNINDWNFGGSNVTKVYRNGAVVYYKISGEGPTPEYQVCFAVVDDISQYSDTEFDDVFNKADGKWYKLNNLNQYEEYGIYGSGRTSCEGSASRLPQGYTEVEYIENTSTAYIDTGAYLDTSNFEIGYVIGNKQQLFGYVHQGCGSCTWLGVEQSATMWWGNFNNNASISSYLTSDENTIIFTQSGATINGNNISKTLSIGSDSIANIPLIIFARYNFNGNTIEHRTDSYMKLKSFYLKNNGTLVRDFVSAKRNSDGKYGLYDIVNDVFYLSPNNVDFSGGEPITPTDCVTTYKGKLTIDDGYEYEWNDSSWVNLGEVSGSSRVPQGYTQVEYIENTSTAYINTEVLLYDSITNSYEIETKMSSTWGGGEFEYLLATEGTSSPYNGLELRWNTHYQSGGELQCESVPKNVTYSNIDNGDGTSAITISCTSTNATNDVPLSLFCGIWSSGPWRNGKGKIYDLKITKNDVLVRDLVPCKRDSDGKYGLYDIVNDVFYLSPNNVNFSGGDPTTPTSGFKIGDIDTPITSDASLITDGMYGIILPVSLSANTSSAIALMGSSDTNTLSNLSSHTKTSVISENDIIDYAVWKFHGTATANTFYVENVATKKYFGYSNVSSSSYMPLVDDSSKVPTVFSAFTKNNVTAFGICKGNTPNQYYAINDLYTYHYQYNWFNTLSQAGDLNNSFVIYKLKGSNIEYPKYYSEKSEPLDDLTFNTLADAQAYAEANCVYDGMHATIDGDRYKFDSTDENGWVKILEYYKVEDVTPNAASGWTISGSSTYNPDSSYYDDFDLETSWTNSSYKIAKVTIYGYDHFTYYLRSYHSYTSSYGYVLSTDIDEISTPPSSIGYNSNSAITNTYYFNKSPKSSVNLGNYRRVTYNNLDKTVEHTFYVYFYGYKYGSYVGNATILIPKEQTNENWEQVTFSASSNVASAQKSLYIDNNNSTSGGTQYWYYRWIIGLPSGSHSSHTNYINYDYCPNVTSSTFTSVEGEKRQVNFTYDNTTNKTLSFRLTDGSNVLTPSNTVYYNMTYYNSCGVSNSSNNLTFPMSKNVKVGGRFRFTNSSNRHYIYGYSPNISLNYDYYADNYQDTFDITYTKLNDEAVTITYTTYDPSDTEVPAFNTKITYPYNGGTTSATTLTSFNVPYTYPYEVGQTNNMFSADIQSYTANQSARAISFTLYPNNREFASVSDLEAYQYAWEGMKAKVGDTKYKYENGEWVEGGDELPNVPFTVNYNAKQYNASTKTLLKTEGQLADVDAVITAGTPTVHDGYLTIATSTRATISGYQNYFNRDNNNPNLTIISKQRTDGTYGHMFANRDSNYNWMYRPYSDKLTLHGSNEQGSISVTTQPVIESVRIDSNRLARYNNYTNNTSSLQASFNYGSTNNQGTALFAGYYSNSGEWFVGDFYWIYMCQGTLTDEQVQQVIDYNENL